METSLWSPAAQSPLVLGYGARATTLLLCVPASLHKVLQASCVSLMVCREYFEYLFSQASLQNATASGTYNAFVPNSVQVMVPESSNPDAGVVRVIVKDSNDVQGAQDNATGDPKAFWLDSDGTHDEYAKAQSGGANQAPPGPAVLDGQWHMVTVTTQPSGDKGIR